MTEQEQASALARWLDEPPGTPPPPGLDPEVIEAVFAVRPDLAPAPRLTADDILDGFDFGGTVELGPEAGQVLPFPRDGHMPETPVEAAPAPWRAANRVAGIGVLLATAATLLLVALPTLDAQYEPAAELMAPQAADRVASAPARAADPIASVDDEARQWTPPPEGEPPADQVAAGPQVVPEVAASAPAAAPSEPIPVTGLTYTAEGSDAVADVGEIVEDQRRPYEMEQQPRFAGVDADKGMIAEAEEALRDQVGGAQRYDDDAVVQAELDELSAGAASAEPQAAESKKQARPTKRKEDVAKAETYEVPAAPAAAADAPAPASLRSAAVPSDVDDRWRGAADAATVVAVDQALGAADALARAGNYQGAADAVLPLVGQPPMVGQYLAGRAAQWLLWAGQARGARDVAQRGLGLGMQNTPYRAQLLLLLGDAQQALGDASGAQGSWAQAAALNAAR